MVLLQRVGILRSFGLKTGIDFPHFGLESGLIGFLGNYGSVIVPIPNKDKYANSKWILRNRFCCCSNLSNDDIIS